MSGPSSVDAVVVLGCAVRAGRPSAALDRRIALAVRAYREGLADSILATGGTSWDGYVEADVIATELALRAPGAPIVRETRSRSTVENAYHGARILHDRGQRRVMLATCAWHLERALLAFRRCGLDAVAPPLGWLEGPPPSAVRRVRERVSRWFDALRLARLADME